MEEMGLMRTRTGWLAWLLTVGLACVPTGVRGQEPGRPDPVYPLPLNDQLHKGGFYAAADFVMFRQDNPLKHQIIAVRGLLDFDGSITADLNGTVITPINGPPIIIPGQAKPGTFIGSGATALSADDAGGPLSYQPGTRLTAGWKFRDGSTIELSWLFISEAKYAAVATLVPPSLNPGPLLADSFLFSPVFNFPNEFAGPDNKLAIGNPRAAFGIWNAATVMGITFVQRFDQWDLGGRIPVFETDYCRCYGWVGARHASLWENFKWRTVAQDFNGQAGQDDVAIYSDVVSNQMYGVDIGVGTEWYLAHGFSVSLDGKAAAMVDMVHEIAKYERSDFVIANKRAKREYTFVPEFTGAINVWWYPIEGVEIRVGYEIMEFINTIAAPEPVSFNYGGLDVDYKRTARFFDGFNIGIGFIF
jgi:hypothetical protein